jgi:hypothetical protein
VFEPFAPAIDAFAKRLARNYREVFGKAEPDHAHLLRAVAKLALERIAATDALYHDALHTLAVAEVGQAVLRGRAMVEPVSRECWLHLTVATLLHDVGYLRGTCPGDGNGRYVVDAADLVGQLADPAYPRKPAALYREPRETGVAERLGYRDPADLASSTRGSSGARWSRTSGRRWPTWGGPRRGGVGGAALRARVRGGARAAPARDGAGRGRRRRRAAAGPGLRAGRRRHTVASHGSRRRADDPLLAAP